MRAKMVIWQPKSADIINPVLQRFSDQGVDISLAMPADVLFTPNHVKNCDTITCIMTKGFTAQLHGFGETVNITLGLYIRTSVDHSTASDLAGQAKPS